MILIESEWIVARWRCPVCTNPTYGVTITGPSLDMILPAIESHFADKHPEKDVGEQSITVQRHKEE